MKAWALAVMLSSAMLVSGARAVQVVGGPTPQNQRPTVEMQSPSAMRDESNALGTGVIDDVDVAAGRIVIQGVPLLLDPAAVQVFSARGTALSPSVLQKHQSVRFLLDRTDSKHPAIRVIYLK
jgi:hypothetical protein